MNECRKLPLCIVLEKVMPKESCQQGRSSLQKGQHILKHYAALDQDSVEAMLDLFNGPPSTFVKEALCNEIADLAVISGDDIHPATIKCGAQKALQRIHMEKVQVPYSAPLYSEAATEY